MSTDLKSIVEQRRLPSPGVTPQALAWHGGALWIGSRDLRRVYGVNAENWSIFEEREAPGIPWAAVSTGDALRFTIGEGAEDDRYIWSYTPGAGFSDAQRFACPDFTGSYLSHDGEHLYLSQWYKHRILKLSAKGEVLREIQVGAEICGHTFADGWLHVLRGTEQDGEHWRIARLDPREATPDVRDVATVPFASRSLAYDGKRFWSNYRSNGETIAFTMP